MQNECDVYGNLVIAEAPGGVNFPIKYLWMFQLASRRYDFQHFLCLNGDYFLFISWY